MSSTERVKKYDEKYRADEKKPEFEDGGSSGCGRHGIAVGLYF